jgi:tight adherence protein C
MMLLLIGVLLGAGAVVLLVRGLMFNRLQGGAILSRINAYTETAPILEKEKENALLDSLAANLGKRFGKMFDEDELRLQIMGAGLYSLTPQRLVGYKVLALGGPPLLWLMMSASIHANPLLMVAGLVLAVFGGWRLPTAYLDRHAKTRMGKIDRGMPSLVDLLVVTVEAGVSLPGSLQIASERMQGPLRDEIRLLLKEQQMGLGISEAMQNMQKRCPSPAMTSFVRALSQTEQLGVSIGKIMRDLSTDMRARRKATAEEKAQKAPVKMLFPLIFLIFPSMLCILMGPAVLELLKTFAGGK